MRKRITLRKLLLILFRPENLAAIETRIDRLEKTIAASGLDSEHSTFQTHPHLKSGYIESQAGLSDKLSVLVVNEKGNSSYVGTR